MSAHMAKRQSIFGYLDATFRQRDVCLVDKTVSDPKPISDSPSSLAENEIWIQSTNQAYFAPFTFTLFTYSF